eukprot:3314874-Amphidinium_carterae.1
MLESSLLSIDLGSRSGEYVAQQRLIGPPELNSTISPEEIQRLFGSFQPSEVLPSQHDRGLRFFVSKPVIEAYFLIANSTKAADASLDLKQLCSFAERALGRAELCGLNLNWQPSACSDAVVERLAQLLYSKYVHAALTFPAGLRGHT